MRTAKSTTWFERGIEALQQIGRANADSIGLRNRYVCPICIRGFHRADLNRMTLEDAPPRCVGGRKVALTCPDCNHTSGFRLDKHVARQANFQSGWADRPLPATLSIGSVSAKVELSVTTEGGRAKVINTANFRRHNSPHVSDAMAHALDRVTRSGGELTLHVPLNHDSRLAYIGWLRSAYVVAFATFGYSYILQPELDIVRRQIQNPAASLLPDVFGALRDAKQENRIGRTQDPRHQLDIVAVQFGERVIHLPGFTPGSDVYGSMSKMPRDTTLKWEMTEFDWPKEPTHWLDFLDPRPPWPRLELRSRPPLLAGT